MRLSTIFAFLFAAAASIAFGADPSPSSGAAALGNNPSQSCKNQPKPGCIWHCEDPCHHRCVRPDGSTDGSVKEEADSCKKSYIDNTSLGYYHWADDYLVGGRALSPSSCGTCGDSGAIPNAPRIDAQLENLEWTRIHRFRDMTEPSSFGPGVYSTYDYSLRIRNRDDGSVEVAVLDPSNTVRMLLADSGSGVYTGVNGDRIRDLRFYTGSAGTGTQVADPTLAASAVLTQFDGTKLIFGVFDERGQLPSPWQWGDIGYPSDLGSNGSVGYSTDGTVGTFHLTASGTDVWGQMDSFGYIYQAIDGDCTIISHVASLATYRGLAADGTNEWAKAGVMIRKSLDRDDDQVDAIVTGSNGVRLQSRTSYGTTDDDFGTSGAAPEWVKLVRSGGTITGYYSTDGSTWSSMGSVSAGWGSVVYVGLALTAHDSTVLSDAAFDHVSVTGTAASSWPTPVNTPYTSIFRAGRLTTIRDRNGYTTTITYPTLTSTQIAESPSMQWEMSSITDPHGRTLGVTYGTSQVAGRWAISSVTLPYAGSISSRAISYSYSGGLISGVTFPDSTTSSFTYTPDSATNCTIVAIDDAGADTTHRRKSVYLTNVFTSDISNENDVQTYDQASNLVRMVLNGEGEVSYLNWSVDGITTDVYEGGGRAKRIGRSAYSYFVKEYESWSFSSTTGFSGTFESTYPFAYFDNYVHYQEGSSTEVTDSRGVVIDYTFDSDRFPVTATYSDSTTEEWSYDGFKQVTRHKDRLNRVQKWTYDTTTGNLTQHEVGIIDVSGTDVHQIEYAHEDWTYNTSGETGLLHSYSDFNGNTTTYSYTTASGSSQHLVASIVTPADTGSGTITAWQFGYDAIGRRTSVTDAVSRQVTYGYDSRDRLTTTTYPDTSTEITVYGTGTDKNLVVGKKDREGTLTEFVYDNDGRCTDTWSGRKTMSADGSTTTTISSTTVQNESLAFHEQCTFLYGATEKASCVLNPDGSGHGNETDYTYDYRRRVATTTRFPTSSTTGLTTSNTYTNNLLSEVTDPYERNTYFVYRTSDARRIRTVQGMIPSDGITSAPTSSSPTRLGSDNPAYVITDDTLDAEGQVTTRTDPRGITTTMAYDSRGRLTQKVEGASDSSVAGTTLYTYDAQSNQTEVDTPRWSDSSDTNGYHADKVTMAYTQRNLLASRTEAAGVTGVTGTDSYTYYDDGRINQRTDANGKVWTTTWGACCGRIQGQLDPSVTLPGAGSATNPARITRHNDYGDLTHEAVVSDYSATSFPTLASPTNHTDVNDASTINEVTMSYDTRHRRTARTVWLSAQGTIDANSPSIATSTSAGLTTKYRYDDNLADSYGLSSSSDPDSVYPYLSGLSLGSKGSGSAMVEINPAGEHRWTIFDGLGRVVRVVDGNGHATTTTYDTIVSGTTSDDGLVATTVTDAVSDSTTRRADASGHVRAIVDAASKRTAQAFDEDGNLKQVRDADTAIHTGGIGYDATFDARNRMITRTDTNSAETQWSYDRNGNVTSMTDALSHATTTAYDARDRKHTVTDRVSGVTTFGYDANSNLTSILDADAYARSETSPTTTYTYDARNLLASETFRHDLSTSDSRSYAYDGARRLATRTDQASVVTTYVYDFVNRLTERDYPQFWSGVSWNDTFAYDTASRLTSATSQRYGNTVTRDYTTGGEAAGRLVGETLTIGSATYTVGYGYDNANRLTSTTYPDSKVATRAYTNRDQLYQLGYDSTTVATRSYTDGMRLSSTAYHNGLTENRDYFADGLVDDITTSGVDGFTYSYDADKRKTQESRSTSTETQNFSSYDDEGRLTGWNRNTSSANQSWTLTKVGDWSQTSSTAPTSFTDNRTHNAVHELTQVNRGTATNLLYDAKGNIVIDERAQQFTFDDENRLWSSRPSTVTYAYDALGRRIQKTVDNVLTTFVNGGAQTLSEYTGALWQSADIGSVGTAGSVSYASGVVSVTASGTDIWGTSDQFRFTYQTLTGDGAIITQVTSLGATDPWSKAGLMLRDSLSADSKFAMVVTTPSNGVSMQYRTSTGGSAGITWGSGSSAPRWLGITRSGTTVTAYESSDANSWSNIGSVTVSMGSTVYVGYAVTAHNNSATTTATFTGTMWGGGFAPATAPAIARSYVYASYVDEPLALISGSSRYYYHANCIYSVAALTDSSGTVQERYRYDAYGTRTVLDGAGTTVRALSGYGNQIGFTGRYHDDETGLVYFRNRYLSAALGRFTSRNEYCQSQGPIYDSRIFNPDQIILYQNPFSPQMNYADGANLYLSTIGVKQGIDPSGSPGDELSWISYLCNKYNLSREGRRALHDLITKQGYTEEEIEEIAKDLGSKISKFTREDPRRGGVPGEVAEALWEPVIVVGAGIAIGSAIGYGIYKFTPDPSTGGTGAGCGSKGNFSYGSTSATAWGSKVAMERATQAAMAACAAMSSQCSGDCCPAGQKCSAQASIADRQEHPSNLGFTSTAIVNYICYCGCVKSP